MNHLDFPYHLDALGRTASTGEADHVRDLIEQVLLTTPGERVMRPEFGAGLLAMVFEPNAVALAATRQFVVQSALQQHLGHLIAVQAVEVVAEDATLQVSVRYRLLRDGSQHDARLGVPGGQP
jgi:uncharacterized protein